MSRGHRRIDVWQAVFLLGGAAMLVWILATSDRDILWQIAGNLTVWGSVQMVFLAILVHLVLALRLRLSTPALAAQPLARILGISLRQGILLLALPARGGDLTYPFVLARLANMPVRDAVMNLLLIRSADFLVIALYFVIAFLLVSVDITTGVASWALIAATLLVAGGTFFAIEPLSRTATRATLRLSGGRRHALVRLFYRLNRMAGTVRMRRKWTVLSMTVLRWAAGIYLFWTLVNLAGADLTPTAAFFSVMCLLAFSLIPVQTIGGIGAGDGAFVAAMVAVGVSLPQAIIVAITVRIAWIILLLGTALVLLRPIGHHPSAGQAS